MHNWDLLYGWLGEQLSLLERGKADIWQSDAQRRDYAASGSALQDVRRQMRSQDPGLEMEAVDEIGFGLPGA